MILKAFKVPELLEVLGMLRVLVVFKALEAP